MELQTNKYYWVKSGDDYIPIYHNHSKEWKLVVNNTSKYVTVAKIKSLFGKESILRPIDFKKDKMFGTLPKNRGDIMLFPYAIKADNGESTVIMRNNNVLVIDTMVLPASELADGYYLDYKEEA